MSNPKNGEKIPSLIVFGRIRGSKVDQAAVFLEKDGEAAKKAASDAGLSSPRSENQRGSKHGGRFVRTVRSA